jgi:hypothetical protein
MKEGAPLAPLRILERKFPSNFLLFSFNIAGANHISCMQFSAYFAENPRFTVKLSEKSLRDTA